MKNTVCKLVLLLILLPFSAFAEARHLTILHFNDFHAHFKPDDVSGKMMGGAARLAGAIRDVEKENMKKGWDTILLYGGDAFTGSPISSEFEGEAEFEFLDDLSVDAMVIGNHEFDYKIPRLQELMKEADFPVLSANIYFKDGDTRFATPHLIIDEDGLDIAIIGLTTVETVTSTTPSYVMNLKFRDVVKESKEQLKEIGGKDTFVIALTHLGVDEDMRLAGKVRGIDAVIGGHDHVAVENYCRVVNAAPVCQAPSFGHYLGRLDFEIDGGKTTYLGSELIPIDEKRREDPEVSRLVMDYGKKVDVKFNEVIGSINVTLDATRGKRTELGTLICEALQEKSNTDICLINSGGIRASLKKGRITKGDIVEILPFKNRVVAYRLTGEEIQKAIAHGVEKGGGAFPQVSGIDFDVVDGAVLNITVGGAPIDLKRKYNLCTIDFLTEGGDGYTTFKKRKAILKTDEVMSDIVIDFIRAKKKLSY